VHLAGRAAPVTVNLFGIPVITWRGVPLIPCDKLEIKSRFHSNQWLGTTSILLVRVGEADQGVVGLHQIGIPGEILPSLSARLMKTWTLSGCPRTCCRSISPAPS
jgi:hypothetical protein